MKNSIIRLVKNGLLFYILFSFFATAFSFFFSACINALSDIRVLDLSFYHLQPMYIQFCLIDLYLYIIIFAALRYFRLLLAFISVEETENERTENEITKLHNRQFSKRVMSIVLCLILSTVFSIVIQILGTLSRY